MLPFVGNSYTTNDYKHDNDVDDDNDDGAAFSIRFGKSLGLSFVFRGSQKTKAMLVVIVYKSVNSSKDKSYLKRTNHSICSLSSQYSNANTVKVTNNSNCNKKCQLFIFLKQKDF